jgi:adenosylcobinamide-GDP ribazoletransferase
MCAEKRPHHPRSRRSKVPHPSKADPAPEVEPRRDLLRESWLAASACTGWIPPPRPNADADAAEHRRALVFLPIVGLIIGVALALCDRAASSYLPPLAASAIIVTLAALLSGGLLPAGLARTVGALIASNPADGAPSIGWRGAAAAILTLAAEILALDVIASPPARGRALVLAMLLSRWAIVPIAYGLTAREQTGLGIPYFGGVTFSEFGISSVIALGLAMGLYDVVGLAAIISVALAILSLRLLLSRHLGGVGGNALAAGAAVCELISLVVLAAISNI